MPIAEKFPLPDKLTTYNSMEGLIQHFELIMPNRGVETPHDEVYAAVESPNGELGLLPGLRRQPDGLAGADAPALVHPLCRLSQDHQGPDARRRGGRAGKLEHHCRRARPLAKILGDDHRPEATAMPAEPTSVNEARANSDPLRAPSRRRSARCFRAIRASEP